MLHGMKPALVSLREMRTNFRSVKRKLETHGEVVVTENGVPSFVLRRLPPPSPEKRRPLPDYWRRLLKLQPQPISAEETRQLHGV